MLLAWNIGLACSSLWRKQHTLIKPAPTYPSRTGCKTASKHNSMPVPSYGKWGGKSESPAYHLKGGFLPSSLFLWLFYHGTDVCFYLVSLSWFMFESLDLHPLPSLLQRYKHLSVPAPAWNFILMNALEEKKTSRWWWASVGRSACFTRIIIYSFQKSDRFYSFYVLIFKESHFLYYRWSLLF